MPFHLPRLTTLNRSSIHRGGSGVEEIFPSDEIHNWFISARETKACWKTIFGIIELPYTFFFPLPFFSRRFFIAIFPFLFVLFFFFHSLFLVRPFASQSVERTRPTRVFSRKLKSGTQHGLRGIVAHIPWSTGFTSRLLGSMMGQAS